MAKFRQVHVEYWQDGFVLDLTPEEKYFYIYLMTNSKTTQCGIYELPKRIIETETGYNHETVDKLLKRFMEYGKIKYDDKTKEIIILNWIKYNAVKSPKVLACIKKELDTVKNKGFIKEFIGICKQYGYYIDTLSIDYGEEEEQEEEQEQEKEQEKEQQQEQDIDPDKEQNHIDDNAVSEIIGFWDTNGFGANNINGKQQLLSWLEDSSFVKPKFMILKAMGIACTNNKRRLNYVEGILKNWENESLLTPEEVEAHDNRKTKPKTRYDPTKDRF